jgi:hypothetical protein
MKKKRQLGKKKWKLKIHWLNGFVMLVNKLLCQELLLEWKEQTKPGIPV